MGNEITNSNETLPIRMATCFGLGYLPTAPGTWGSLAGLPVAALLHWLAWNVTASTLLRVIIVVAALSGLSAVALWAVGKTQKAWNSHDDGRIVIDEVLGQAIALVFFSPTATTLLLGFVLFRILDIFKPWPISWADRSLKGAPGVIIDDLIAGVLTAIILFLLVFLP